MTYTNTSAPTLSPSFLLAQAIFEPNLFPYKYSNILKHSHSSYLSAYEDERDSVPKRRHVKFRRQGITQKKAYNNWNVRFPTTHHRWQRRKTSRFIQYSLKRVWWRHFVAPNWKKTEPRKKPLTWYLFSSFQLACLESDKNMTMDLANHKLELRFLCTLNNYTLWVMCVLSIDILCASIID